MDFRFLHASLSIPVVEESQRRLEWFRRLGHNVDKCSALSIRKKLITCNGYGHRQLGPKMKIQQLHLQISYLRKSWLSTRLGRQKSRLLIS
jgi:hypothetical protein